ncbi:hypothetical protein RND81_05G078200 [Saponaria officinalis]|uniref:Uncharacterized protein n=1 Tax=Saponaria officinalis TaxID=3572 RepID=A0AAW1KWK3_SAPOF
MPPDHTLSDYKIVPQSKVKEETLSQKKTKRNKVGESSCRTRARRPRLPPYDVGTIAKEETMRQRKTKRNTGGECSRRTRTRRRSLPSENARAVSGVYTKFRSFSVRTTSCRYCNAVVWSEE